MVCVSTSQAYRFELALLLAAQVTHSLCVEFCIIPILQGLWCWPFFSVIFPLTRQISERADHTYRIWSGFAFHWAAGYI
jgi:hypothetical protein